MKKPALAVMGRAPIPGEVKTRLQPGLSADRCASLYRAFLLDAIDLATSLPSYQPFLAYAPANAEGWFQGMVHEGVGLVRQVEGDLGARMNAIMSGLLRKGHPAVVITGSDIPTLQPGTLEEALRSLEINDLCLGPTADGGYYLIGARKACQEVFRGIQWSTPGVFEATLKRAEQAGLSVGVVERYADVDTADDLRRLPLDLEKLRGVSGARMPAHTLRWLSENRSETPIPKS
ncbi:MAG: TIGR04282 family arsenosugar biosynthesis glycosyltransferase [Dehalococcoidia bacterium]|nr:TIGR04282 family arsenosugar biosynthesis glycosyltransferase [Dehalococcoidia bacterium]